MATMNKISPCLWFDTQAEEAAKFYVSIFKDSAIESVARYPEAGQEVHRKPAGSVMLVNFRVAGQTITALNGGPEFKFSEAISLQVFCDDQEEVDTLWRKLTDGGAESQCGWLKDKFGLSWQLVPTTVIEMLNDANPRKSAAAMNAVMKMKKIDIATVKRAYDGA